MNRKIIGLLLCLLMAAGLTAAQAVTSPTDLEEWRRIEKEAEEAAAAETYQISNTHTHYASCDRPDICYVCGKSKETLGITDEDDWWVSHTITGTYTWLSRDYDSFTCSCGAYHSDWEPHDVTCVRDTCTHCGHDDVDGSAELYHNETGATYGYDATSCWKICADCGAAIESTRQEHSRTCMDAGTGCSRCGQTKVTVSVSHGYLDGVTVMHDSETHWWVCNDCGAVTSENEPHTPDEAGCCWCGYSRDGVCEHKVLCDNMTHCVLCGATVTEEQIYEIEHVEQYQPKDRYEHQIVCACGQVSYTESHTGCISGSTVCNVCGATGIVTNDAPHHILSSPYGRGNGYCWQTCSFCGQKFNEAKHQRLCSQAYCANCGSTEDLPAETTHDWACSSYDESSHTLYCRICGAAKTESHCSWCDDVGFCYVCEHSAYKDHIVTSVISHESYTTAYDTKTHWSVCNNCGEKFNEAKHTWDSTNHCLYCGTEKPAPAPEQTSFTVTPSSVTISKNETFRLTAVYSSNHLITGLGVLPGASYRKVCTSASTVIAKVSPTGYHISGNDDDGSTLEVYHTVKGSRAGKTTITAVTAAGDKAVCEVTVVDPTVTLNYTGTVTLAMGNTLSLTATLTPATTTNLVAWTSSAPKVASVKDGLVTPLKEGKAIITAKAPNGKLARVTVVVTDPAKATSVTLDKTGTVNVSLGEPLTLTATMTPATATSTLTWTTSNKKVATVANGVVTPVKEGRATVRVTTSTGKSASVIIQVVDPQKATAVTLDASGTVRLALDATLSLKATMTPATAVGPLTWTTSNKKVATVDEGLVTPHAVGTAIITVRTPTGKTAKVTVQVYDPSRATAVTLDYAGTVKLTAGSTLTLTATLTPVTAVSPLTWSSSSPKIATVTDGVVTALKSGRAVITVRTNTGKTAKVTIIIQ